MGIYHGINPYTWRLQLVTDTQREAGGKSMSIAFKDIQRISIRDAENPSQFRDAEKTMAPFRRFFFNQQLRRLLQSQLSSLLRTALASPVTSYLEFGFEGVCSDLEIDDAKIRLRELASRDQARAPPMDLCCQNWVGVFQSLTEFDQILLKTTCLYFNALECPATDGRANPECRLLRKAAYHVLDPAQNVDDLFEDVNADVDEFRLVNGTPAVCISALHLAAITGDSAMCEVLLKRQADVNVNVLLLPVPDVDGSLYELCSPDVEGLREAHSLEMNTIPISDIRSSSDGEGYDVDFGHVTPLCLAQHFGHTAVETLLRQRSGHNGHSPEEHYAKHGKRRTHDAPNIARRRGIPYVGIYERPLRRGTCVGSCLFYSQPRRTALASLGGDPDVDARGAVGESDSEVESEVSARGQPWGRDWATSGMIGSDRDFDSDPWNDSD